MSITDSLLDKFLLDRGCDECEGILNVSELDGYLTAIVSAPDMIMPSVRLQGIWGDEDYVWDSQEQFAQAFGIITSLHQSIAECLKQNQKNFEPMIQCRLIDGKEFMIVDGWCECYLKGVDMWHDIPKQTSKSLKGISGFTERDDWP